MLKFFVLIVTVLALAQALHYGEEGIDVKINVEKNSNSYLSGRLPQGSFEYGLNVEKKTDNHFQHKVKGPDDVTYGCYGFVDPDGKPHLVHYVSDLKGYRVVPPDTVTKIYISRLEGSINNVYQASQEKNVQWKDLFFPPACKQLSTDLNEATPPPPVTSTSTTPSPSTPTTPELSTSTTTRRPKPPNRPAPPTPSISPPSSPTPPEPEIVTSTTPRRPSRPKRPVTLPVTPSSPVPPSSTTPTPPETELIEPSNCSSVIQAPPGDLVSQPACSKVCDELKDELEDIKAQLKTLLDMLAEKPKGKAGGNGSKFAYFPVMLSDGLPDGVDASSAKFAFPAVPQQCGSQ